ncbi:hypothetical protein G6F23_015345 [Rhizopus arrhizus]|nr:hypothetical protein G6F23_015345 [Rhizopus arrhizus]
MKSELYTHILDTSYKDTLEHFSLTNEEVIFQQDGDTKHTSKLTKKWLADNGITVGQKIAARNCKIPVLQLVVYGYCTKLSQTLIVCTSLERAFIRRLSDMDNGYWRNLI